MGLDTILNFTACCDCGELYPVPDAGAAFADDANDVDPYKEFLVRHQTHHIAGFRRSGLECHADRPLWDPLATLRFEVTDGHCHPPDDRGRACVLVPSESQNPFVVLERPERIGNLPERDGHYEAAVRNSSRPTLLRALLSGFPARS
jgi:hypothetical protein